MYFIQTLKYITSCWSKTSVTAIIIYKILDETRENVNDSMKIIIDLCNENTIKDLIDKDKVDNYSYELYLELMYTKKERNTFQKKNI